MRFIHLIRLLFAGELIMRISTLVTVANATNANELTLGYEKRISHDRPRGNFKSQ